MSLRPLSFLVAWCLPLALLAAEAPKVELKGLSGSLAKNAHAFLSLAKLPCDAEDWRIQSAQDKAPKEIAQGLQALGYYSPRITAGPFKRQGKCWSQTFSIEPGQVVQLAEVDIRLLGPGASESPAAKGPDFAAAQGRRGPQSRRL